MNMSGTFVLVLLRDKNNLKPLPQNKLSVRVRGFFQNIRREPVEVPPPHPGMRDEFANLSLWRGGGGETGGGNPGVMGAGSLRKAGEEGVGGRISKGGGSWEKWEPFCNIGTIFRNRNGTQRREPLRKGAGTGGIGCGRQEV